METRVALANGLGTTATVTEHVVVRLSCHVGDQNVKDMPDMFLKSVL